MSPIRFYILAALDMHGPLHGHALVALAEEEHVTDWTDISVGGLYGAARRLASEGLIETIRTEKQGNYPERQVFDITDTGREALLTMRREGLAELSWKHDPIDLALWSLDPDTLDELEDVIRDRRDRIADLRGKRRAHHQRIEQYLTPAERIAIVHGDYRLTAELSWHDELLAALPGIIRDERKRKKDLSS